MDFPLQVARPPSRFSLSKVFAPPKKDEDVVIPVDVLLEGVSNQGLSKEAEYKANDDYYAALMESYHESDYWFNKKDLLVPASIDLTLKDHPVKEKNIPYKTGTLLRGGPIIRSPLIIGTRIATITPTEGKVQKDRKKKGAVDANKAGGGGDNDGTAYFLEAYRLRQGTGGDISEEQKEFMEFLATDVASLGVLLMCRETDTMFGPKGTAISALLKPNDENPTFTGKYASLKDVPLNDPKLTEIRNAWLKNGKLIVANKDMARGPANQVFTFNKSATDWKEEDQTKKDWKPMKNIFFWYVFDNRVHKKPISDDKTVQKMAEKCPYGVDFRLKPSFYKGVQGGQGSQYVKYGLEIESLNFFPQLAFLQDKLMNEVPQPKCLEVVASKGLDDMYTDEDEKNMRLIDEMYLKKASQAAVNQGHPPMLMDKSRHVNGHNSNGNNNVVDGIRYGGLAALD